MTVDLKKINISNINFKKIQVKPVINKSNGQINISIPKKQVNKKIIDQAHSGELINLLFEDD